MKRRQPKRRRKHALVVGLGDAGSGWRCPAQVDKPRSFFVRKLHPIKGRPPLSRYYHSSRRGMCWSPCSEGEERTGWMLGLFRVCLSLFASILSVMLITKAPQRYKYSRDYCSPILAGFSCGILISVTVHCGLDIPSGFSVSPHVHVDM